MKLNRIDAFDIRIGRSERPNLKFCIVSPSTFGSEPLTDLIDMFINYHLSIVPNVPVILFQIDNLFNIGSPLHRHIDGTTIYHLPPPIYPYLEDNISESAFVISDALLKTIVDADKMHSSLLSCINKIHADTGLNVIGWYRHED